MGQVRNLPSFDLPQGFGQEGRQQDQVERLLPWLYAQRP